MQRRITSMQRHYEEKLKLMAETIRATELERDKVLKSLGMRFFFINVLSTVDRSRFFSIFQPLDFKY